MARYLLVGHLTRDLCGKSFYYGGAVLYAGLTARRLGFEVKIITASAEKDLEALFPELFFYHFGAKETTTFENLETPQGRRQKVYACAPKIPLDKVPPSLKRAEIVHLAPVLGEVLPAEATLFETSFLVANPQGWFRKVLPDGSVAQVAPDVSSWPSFEALVVSEEDLAFSPELVPLLRKKARYLVVTRGAKGASLYFEGREVSYPAREAPRVVDTTGAGDVFAAAFFAMLYASQKPLVALEFALCLSSFSVSRAGLAAVPTLWEISQCLGYEEDRNA